jgi:hypothetical protein
MLTGKLMLEYWTWSGAGSEKMEPVPGEVDYWVRGIWWSFWAREQQ